MMSLRLGQKWLSHFILKFKVAADMSDSVKQKRLIHCPLFFRGFFILYKQSTGD